MQRGLLILVLALMAGAAAFWLTRSHRAAAQPAVLLDSMPELTWLRHELKLSDTQFAKISALHAAYRPQCAVMCRNIAEAQTTMESMARSNRAMTPELAAAIHNHASVQAQCQQNMLEHLYQTADLLDDQQAARYLATVLPHALNANSGGTTSCQHD